MTVTAEYLFNDIGQNYEDAYADNPGLQEIIQLALAELKPRSQVLDVGCGTGKPVASHISRAGHDVYGIDVSQEMIAIARKQVYGQFEKKDMLTFEPNVKFSAIFSIFSLFQLSHIDTYSMMFKFSDWLEKGGLLVLGTIPSTSLIKDQRFYDSSGQVVRHADLSFMGRKVLGTLYSKDGWRNLCQKAGFEIRVEKLFDFTEQQPYKNEVQEHYFIIASKIVDHALMGPYPLPISYRGPHPLSEGSWAPFAERLVRDEFDAVLALLKDNKNILDVGSGYGSE
jgi:SAM-dependent methyltransferase